MKPSTERARTTHGNISDYAQQEKIRTSRRSTPRQPTSAANTEQKNEVELQQHIRDAVEACRKVHERGNIPIAPHLYWPRFLDDNDPQDRDYGIAAGLEALKRCDEMIVIIRQEGPEEEWISQGMQAEIAAAAKMGIEPQFIYTGKEKR